MGIKKSSRLDVNYIYFGTLFITLSLTSLGSILAKEDLSGSIFFFSLYACGQALLETTALVFLGWWVKQFLGKVCFGIYIGFTFLLGVLHIFDFLTGRILDLSIWETIDFVMDESLENFLLLLDASGIPLWAWLVLFLLIALLPLLGFCVYLLSETVTERFPWRVKKESLLFVFFCVPAGLLLWDIGGSGVLHPDAYTGFIKSLPWKITLLRPKGCQIAFETPLVIPLSQEKIEEEMERHPRPKEALPNIYLFIIESFREDCITEQIAPHLHAFKKSGSHFDVALSNANCSHVSWYSLLYSQFPFHWNRRPARGSPGLALLRKWGYEVRLYSSAQLGYYGMDELLFGPGTQLLSSYQRFHHKGALAAHETDEMTLTAFERDLQQYSRLRENQVCIFFWDSTHFDYSWPKESASKFTPFATEFDYFKAFQSRQDIELIRNRYRNAVHHIDSLFGKFLEFVPDPEHAIILVLGDHGEEFFEHGHLFHGSHLTHEQIHIPLYMRFGLKNKREAQSHLVVSQMDLFPSVIDFLSGEPPSFLEGQSIFQPRKWPFAITARGNASRAPYEFCLHNGCNKLTVQFSNRSNIFEPQQLQILSLRSCKDESLPECRKHVEQWMGKEFKTGLEHLFQASQ